MKLPVQVTGGSDGGTVDSSFRCGCVGVTTFEEGNPAMCDRSPGRGPGCSWIGQRVLSVNATAGGTKKIP